MVYVDRLSWSPIPRRSESHVPPPLHSFTGLRASILQKPPHVPKSSQTPTSVKEVTSLKTADTIFSMKLLYIT